MITNESQVRLSIELQGRLGAKASNTFTKKQRKKWEKAAKYSKIGPLWYNEPVIQKAYQSILICSDAITYYISDSGRPAGCTPSNWKKKNSFKRLEYHLQIIADSITNKDKTKFSYAVID